MEDELQETAAEKAKRAEDNNRLGEKLRDKDLSGLYMNKSESGADKSKQAFWAKAEKADVPELYGMLRSFYVGASKRYPENAAALTEMVAHIDDTTAKIAAPMTPTDKKTLLSKEFGYQTKRVNACVGDTGLGKNLAPAQEVLRQLALRGFDS